MSLVKHKIDPGSLEKQLRFYIKLFSPPGSGPDGRITKKDIDSFVPPKAAPVSVAQVN